MTERLLIEPRRLDKMEEDSDIRLNLVTPNFRFDESIPTLRQFAYDGGVVEELGDLKHCTQFDHDEVDIGQKLTTEVSILPAAQDSSDSCTHIPPNVKYIEPHIKAPNSPLTSPSYIDDDKIITDTTIDRLFFLENELKLHKSRLDGFSKELKLLLGQVNIVCDWISESFGIQLIDKASKLFQHIYNIDEVEKMSEVLALVNKEKVGVRRSLRRRTPTIPKAALPESFTRKRSRGRPKRKDSTSDESVDEAGANSELPDNESNHLFNPPDSMLNEKIENKSSKPKRKQQRRCPVKHMPKKSIRTEILLNDEIRNDANDANSQDKKRRKWKYQPRNLQCEECGKILKAESSLRWHMLMHADLRPVNCPEPGCGKKFRDKSKLVQHQKIHSGEKSEKCRYCDRGFLRKKDLIVHERTHTGEKPFACTSCDKKFNIKDHLTIHLRVHTGERPYTCPTCSKSFSQANSLRIHKKIHLKQLGGNPTTSPRKPRTSRKSKKNLVPVVSKQIDDTELSTSKSSIIVDVTGLNIGETETTNQNASSTLIVPTLESSNSSVIQTFFQTQTLVDPVQQAWNFVATHPNSTAAVVAVPIAQQHPPPLTQHGLAIYSRNLATYQALSHQHQAQNPGTPHIIRAGSQTSSFVSSSFHDPGVSSFQTFPN